MQFEESIYKIYFIHNLIPKERYYPPKDKRYKSKYPYDMPPTGSTFSLITTTKPNIGNLNGDYQPEGGSHSHKAGGLTFG